MTDLQIGDCVRIRGKDVEGEIIDISPMGTDGLISYTVEKNSEGYTNNPNAYRVAGWELYDCFADQLEKI